MLFSHFLELCSESMNLYNPFEITLCSTEEQLSVRCFCISLNRSAVHPRVVSSVLINILTTTELGQDMNGETLHYIVQKSLVYYLNPNKETNGTRDVKTLSLNS